MSESHSTTEASSSPIAGNLLESAYGAEIDVHDVVMRINQAPLETGEAQYQPYVGNKTHIRLLNRAWTLAYASHDAANVHYREIAEPLEPGVTLVASRTAPLNFVALWKRMQVLERPDVQVLFLRKQVLGFVRQKLTAFHKCLKENGEHSLEEEGVHTMQISSVCCSCQLMAHFRRPGGVSPTSGLVGVAFLSRFCDEVSVYGFGPGSRKGSQYQYYHFGGTERAAGNPIHNFNLELVFLHALAAMGAIRVCGPGGIGCVPNDYYKHIDAHQKYRPTQEEGLRAESETESTGHDSDAEALGNASNALELGNSGTPDESNLFDHDSTNNE
eukprot:scaffold957_cov402-Prasinococcus_capsulatus_cf.AAC.22